MYTILVKVFGLFSRCARHVRTCICLSKSVHRDKRAQHFQGMGFELGSVKQSHWAGAEPGLIFTVPPWSAVVEGDTRGAQ